MSDFAIRLENTRAFLYKGRASLDGLLLSNLTNVGYLTGFTGSNALALITRDTSMLLTDFRYLSQARDECPGWTIYDITKPEALEAFFSERPELVRLGFEATNVTVAHLSGWRKKAKGVKWVPTEGLIEKLRLVKDEDELALMRRAIAIAEDAFRLTLPLLAPGTSEREFALELEFAMRRAGAESVSFDPIVASAENGAFPHYHPGERVFAVGNLVTIDWGARYQGYCSDITRTVLVPGAEPTEKQREIHGIVQEAKERAIAAIRPGKTGKEIDAVARDFIAERGYGDHFGHSLGHSLGRVVHDGMTLAERADKVILKTGMVTTVEPGIYIEGWGGVRIEEDVLVTSEGCVVLTTPSPGLA